MSSRLCLTCCVSRSYWLKLPQCKMFTGGANDWLQKINFDTVYFTPLNRVIFLLLFSVPLIR